MTTTSASAPAPADEVLAEIERRLEAHLLIARRLPAPRPRPTPR